MEMDLYLLNDLLLSNLSVSHWFNLDLHLRDSVETYETFFYGSVVE